MEEIKGYSLGAAGSLVAAGIAAYTRQWGVVSAAMSVASLGTLAAYHMVQEGLPSKRTDEEAGEVYDNVEAALKGFLIGSTVWALIPLSEILLTGGKWADRAYTFQLVLPTLTIAANGYSLASHPDREEEEGASWMPVIERAACFLGTALTVTALGHFAHSPTPILGLVLGGSALWAAYRSQSGEKRADQQLIGVAAASALAATGLLINRYLEGSLIQGMRGKLITLGQGSLLAASVAVLLRAYAYQLKTSE